jgi:hypothetical protein
MRAALDDKEPNGYLRSTRQRNLGRHGPVVIPAKRADPGAFELS